MARILIVDDDVPTLDVLDFCLSMEGHRVLRAENGTDAVELARREAPDLVVLDCMMPVMDGLTAARTLRGHAATSDIPIVMLTARTTDADLTAGYEAGVSSYVRKPLDLEVLFDEVARICPPRSTARPSPAT